MARQTRKDREDESRGMKEYWDEHGRGSGGRFRDGHEPDIGRGEFSNMPTRTYMEKYPKNEYGRGRNLNDSITGIDDVEDDSIERVNRYISNQK